VKISLTVIENIYV